MENQKMNASSISAPSSPELGLSITPTRMERAMRVDFEDLEKKQRIFIEELSLRAWIRTKEKNKNTIERNDFAEENNENKVYDFLADLVPLDPNDHPSSNVKEEHCGIITAEEVTNSDVEAPVMNVGNMISAEAPILLSKACEMFIQEMSLRAWMQIEENKRRVIQRHDVVESIHENKLYDFLTNVIPLQYQGGHPSLVPPPQPYFSDLIRGLNQVKSNVIFGNKLSLL
ncbi:nuclear transcription factor y subunit c-1 [Senna tora]|uniref:Nuclear transcription factor y subunit c-1 n=1 Tax=Senna tora TaxID=362788 RepID=A0A834TH69_9FABA|nr:nuclear transcription factor y subunit c-1 [Senna tora]